MVLNKIEGRIQRAVLKLKPRLRWWMIYGPARCGTTLLFRMLADNAKIQVSDWGLGALFEQPPTLPYIHLDRDRMQRDVLNNVIDTAKGGGGRRLDLAYKSAEMRRLEFDVLVKHWGEPERRILCFREPASYIASAVKKFPSRSLSDLQSSYVLSLAMYAELGGDAFEYHPELGSVDYQNLIHPLRLPENEEVAFQYKGSAEPSLVTPAMRDAYESLRSVVKAPE